MEKELNLQDPEEAEDQEEKEVEVEAAGKKKKKFSLVDAILKGRHNDIHIHLGPYTESE